MCACIHVDRACIQKVRTYVCVTFVCFVYFYTLCMLCICRTPIPLCLYLQGPRFAYTHVFTRVQRIQYCMLPQLIHSYTHSLTRSFSSLRTCASVCVRARARARAFSLRTNLHQGSSNPFLDDIQAEATAGAACRRHTYSKVLFIKLS